MADFIEQFDEKMKKDKNLYIAYLEERLVIKAGSIKQLQSELDKLKERFEQAMSQNYCTICGNTLDGYVPPGNKMDEELKQQTIKTLEWMVVDMRWREDQIRGNLDKGSQGGYSPELQSAIDLLKKWKEIK